MFNDDSLCMSDMNDDNNTRDRRREELRIFHCCKVPALRVMGYSRLG